MEQHFRISIQIGQAPTYRLGQIFQKNVPEIYFPLDDTCLDFPELLVGQKVPHVNLPEGF